MVKFSFFEKATKICAIVVMVLKFTYLVNVKTMRTIAQIFVAFSEKLNFPTFFFILQSTSDNLYFFFSQMKKWDIVGPNKRAMSDIEIPTPFSVYKASCRKRKF